MLGRERQGLGDRSRSRRMDELPSGGLGAVASVSSRARACCMGCNASATTWRSRASISSIDTPASRPSASAFFSACSTHWPSGIPASLAAAVTASRVGSPTPLIVQLLAKPAPFLRLCPQARSGTVVRAMVLVSGPTAGEARSCHSGQGEGILPGKGCRRRRQRKPGRWWRSWKFDSKERIARPCVEVSSRHSISGKALADGSANSFRCDHAIASDRLGCRFRDGRG